MKKIIIPISGLVILSNTLMANGELTGDMKLACEAILCLSSGTRPSECAPALRRYFSIKAKKAHETIKKRKNFLKLCPTDETAKIDNNYESLIDTLSNVSSGCDANTLNRITQKSKATVSHKLDNEGYSYPVYERTIRITPKKPQYCIDLEKHTYGIDNQRVKYTCNGEYFFVTDWQRGYKLKQINEADFKLLPSNISLKQNNPAYKECDNYEYSYKQKQCRQKTPQFLFFEKIAINKKCWVETE
ncbi:hypothetical protein KDE13_09250 [Campylobacter sp. faydin G-140]|uniref:TrbM/KikA/MpfK family conjugal transfer protein n=1 Tax=Campylobacter anatolicus TaxID=2829105 RepID=UPI001B930DCF|nr:TrbM/KikA/MpfK family conjugal transfer protein [Campylobacter anatolicus]MBR8466519.1 hypothetical protein [Campylobacter anatolicus]